MELLETDDLSQEQLQILQKRVEHVSYRDIQTYWTEKFHSFIRLEAIETCIIRGCLGFKWEKGMNGVDMPYLCPADMRALTAKIKENAEN